MDEGLEAVSRGSLLARISCGINGHRWGEWVSVWPEVLVEIKRCLRCPAQRTRRTGLR